VDLFFSRIGLSATGSSGVPIDTFGGARLSAKSAATTSDAEHAD
jgi:hypothetical protein